MKLAAVTAAVVVTMTIAGCSGASDAAPVVDPVVGIGAADVVAEQVVPGRFMPGAEGSWAFIEATGNYLVGVGIDDQNGSGEMVDIGTGEVVDLPALPEGLRVEQVAAVESGVVVVGELADDDTKKGFRFVAETGTWSELDLTQVAPGVGYVDGDTVEPGPPGVILLSSGDTVLGLFYISDEKGHQVAVLRGDTFSLVGQVDVPIGGDVCATADRLWLLDYSASPLPNPIDEDPTVILVSRLTSKDLATGFESSPHVLREGQPAPMSVEGLACTERSAVVVAKPLVGPALLHLSGAEDEWVATDWEVPFRSTIGDAVSGVGAVLRYSSIDTADPDDLRASHVAVRRKKVYDLPERPGSQFRWAAGRDDVVLSLSLTGDGDTMVRSVALEE